MKPRNFNGLAYNLITISVTMKAAFCLAFLLLPYEREQIFVSGLSVHKFEPSRFGNNKILMKLQLINFLQVWQWKQPNFKIFFSNARIRKNTNLCICFESFITMGILNDDLPLHQWQSNESRWLVYYWGVVSIPRVISW